MEDNIVINAEARVGNGKAESRRLRRQGKVPLVVYGGGKEPIYYTTELDKLCRMTKEEKFYTGLVSIKHNESEEKVVVREVQKHPSKPIILHLDLQRVTEGKKIKMLVPLKFKGAATSPGVKSSGGIVSYNIAHLYVHCLPNNIPEQLEADLSNMKIGESMHLSDISIPEGVEIVSLKKGNHDLQIANIHK